MADIIIIAVIAIVLFIGINYTLKHFKGEGGCCGGGSRITKKKLLEVKYKKYFIVDGMHCNQCKARLEENINRIDGISGRVNLRKKELCIFYSKDVSDDVIISCVIKSGYTVIL